MPKQILSNPGGSHLSTAKFRAYEDILLDLVATYPGVLRLKPAIAVSSTVVRIREAANSFISREERPESCESPLDHEKFCAIWRDVQVSGCRDEVMIGRRQDLVAARQAKFETLHEAAPAYTISNPSYQNILSLYDLLLSGAILGPIYLTGTIPPFPPIPGVEYDVRPDGSVIML